jgi:ribose transport system ATP-binding protein
LKAQGTAIVYISHRFDELYAVCDKVTVLRDGKLVGTRELAGLERIDLICMMLGKQREDRKKAGRRLSASITKTKTAHRSERKI